MNFQGLFVGLMNILHPKIMNIWVIGKDESLNKSIPHSIY